MGGGRFARSTVPFIDVRRINAVARGFFCSAAPLTLICPNPGASAALPNPFQAQVYPIEHIQPHPTTSSPSTHTASQVERHWFGSYLRRDMFEPDMQRWYCAHASHRLSRYARPTGQSGTKRQVGKVAIVRVCSNRIQRYSLRTVHGGCRPACAAASLLQPPRHRRSRRRRPCSSPRSSSPGEPWAP